MNENIYLSHLAKPLLKEYLQQYLSRRRHHCKEFKGQLIEVMPTDNTYPAVCTHADLYHCAVGNRILSGVPAGYSYPSNIGFNGVHLGSFFIHNFKYTAPAVLSEIEVLGLTKIHVKQGYTKCNLVVVSKDAVITSDRGIAKALSSYPIHVLLITPGYVDLPGFSYGFLGGASGLLENEVIFHGDLSAHPDFHKIVSFIIEHHKKPVWFSSFPLTDIGSIITLL